MQTFYEVSIFLRIIIILIIAPYPPAIPTNRLSTIYTRVRHKAQQERQVVLKKRRKEYQRKLRLQDAEAEAARAAMAQARDAWYTAARKSRKLQAAADKRARGRETGRFVRAAGAVKALRAKKFEPAELLAAGSNWTLRLAKSIGDRINRVDDEELEGERSDVGWATNVILCFYRFIFSRDSVFFSLLLRQMGGCGWVSGWVRGQKRERIRAL